MTQEQMDEAVLIVVKNIRKLLRKIVKREIEVVTIKSETGMTEEWVPMLGLTQVPNGENTILITTKPIRKRYGTSSHKKQTSRKSRSKESC